MVGRDELLQNDERQEGRGERRDRWQVSGCAGLEDEVADAQVETRVSRLEARAARQLVRMTIRPLPAARRRASKHRRGNFYAAHSLHLHSKNQVCSCITQRRILHLFT